jgi:hypothetical protein
MECINSGNALELSSKNLRRLFTTEDTEYTEEEKERFYFGIIWSALALVMHWDSAPRI